MSDEVGNVNDAMQDKEVVRLHVEDDVEATQQQEDKVEGEREKRSRNVNICISISECVPCNA